MLVRAADRHTLIKPLFQIVNTLHYEMSGLWCCFGRRRPRKEVPYGDELDNREVMRCMQEGMDYR